MARVFLVKYTTGSACPVAFTVTNAVGLGCPNLREDVLLVQHLLRIAWQDGAGSNGYRPPDETQPLTADGLCGQKTLKFIKFFQEEVLRRGLNINNDGRVDPVLTGSVNSGISHKFYTIVALNAARNTRRADSPDIAADPGFPAELQKWLYINW